MTKRATKYGARDPEKDRELYGDIVEMIKMGLSMDDMKKNLKIGWDRINNILSEYGNTTVRDVWLNFQREEARRMVPLMLDLIEDGCNKRDLIEKLGVKEHRINDFLGEAGYVNFADVKEDLYYFKKGYFILPKMLEYGSVNGYARENRMTIQELNRMAQAHGYKSGGDYIDRNTEHEKEDMHNLCDEKKEDKS